MHDQFPSHFARFAVLPVAFALSACALDRPLDDAAKGPVDAPVPRVAGHVPARPSDRTEVHRSHCAANESVLISCRIAGTEDFASICVSTEPRAEHRRVYYAFGPRTQPVSLYPDDRSAHAGRFRKAVFQRPAGIGSGYAYTFKQGADKYVFYSVNSEDNADFGVLRLPSGGGRPSRMVCDQDGAVEFGSEALYRFTQTWDRDAEIDGRGLPPVED